MGANPNILLPGFWRSGAHGIPVPVVWPLLLKYTLTSWTHVGKAVGCPAEGA